MSGCGPVFDCLPHRAVLVGLEPTAVISNLATTDLIATMPLGTELLVAKYRAVELPALLTFVDVKVRACVLTCCPPRRSSLTLYGDFNTFTTGLQQLRPRRATELWIASGSGGAPALSTWHWSNVEGTFNGGNFNINAGFVNGVIYPGNLEVIVYDDLGQNNIVMVWRIE